VNKTSFSLEYAKSILDYDPDKGIFTYKIKRSRQPAGAIAGTKNKYGHIEIHITKKKVQAHRLAWFFVYGEWPSGLLDHINRNPSDNSIRNLRVVTTAENQQNRKVRIHGRLPGARKLKGCSRWAARIVVNREQIHLGRFDTEEEAHAAYMAAKAIHHPLYAPAGDRSHD
jgi:hypothetical protein